VSPGGRADGSLVFFIEEAYQSYSLTNIAAIHWGVLTGTVISSTLYLPWKLRLKPVIPVEV